MSSGFGFNIDGTSYDPKQAAKLTRVAPRQTPPLAFIEFDIGAVFVVGAQGAREELGLLVVKLGKDNLAIEVLLGGVDHGALLRYEHITPYS
jgi:hypothetical protein